jgi:hypothetical protein
MYTDINLFHIEVADKDGTHFISNNFPHKFCEFRDKSGISEFSGSRDGSVGVATGWRARVRFLEGARFFSSQRPHRHRLWGPPSLLFIGYPGGGGALSRGVKRQGREADHSPPSSAEVKKCGAIPPHPHRSSLRTA